MTFENNSIYISGPMTGIPGHNFRAFFRAARRFRENGWEVENPAENFSGRTDLPRPTYLRKDVTELACCHAIAMLPGWQKSRGARLEYLLARELELKIYDAETLRLLSPKPEAVVLLLSERSQSQEESVLEEALRITSGSRQSDYGHPTDDFGRTALMWNGILAGKLREGGEITAADVPLCMIAVKLARQANRHKRDNLVDIAGYSRTAAMVAGDE
jgi:hypothetical protein